jgi:hypothetical protein
VTRALVVIDGEHYASFVRDAIAELPYDWSVRGSPAGRRSCAATPTTACRVLGELEDGLGEAEVVVDLSDEPVLGPRPSASC